MSTMTLDSLKSSNILGSLKPHQKVFVCLSILIYFSAFRSKFCLCHKFKKKKNSFSLLDCLISTYFWKGWCWNKCFRIRRSWDGHLVVCKSRITWKNKSANVSFTAVSVVASIVAFVFTFVLDCDSVWFPSLSFILWHCSSTGETV